MSWHNWHKMHWGSLMSSIQRICLSKFPWVFPFGVHLLQSSWNVSFTNWTYDRKGFSSVKAFSHWSHWNVISWCVLLTLSFKCFLDNLKLHLSHFSICSLTGENLAVLAKTPYQRNCKPLKLSIFMSINILPET